MSLHRIHLGSVLFLLVACGDSSTKFDPGRDASSDVERDAGDGEPEFDAGGEADASEPEFDAGSEPDAGSAGSEPELDAGSDAGDELDAGSDAGDELDAGSEPDASDELDAGSEPEPDAAVEPPDAGQPVPVNVLQNGSFEAWSNALPDHWFGSVTSIDASDVAKVTSGASDGTNALRLRNTLGTHKRFASQDMSLSAGRYTCTYQVRGTGDVRNGFYGTDYSSYSTYTTFSGGQEWRSVTYTFNLAQDVEDTFQLIISVRNTQGEHLLIDDVRCVKAPQP